jgi:deoxyribose-phosphate aldolase
MELTKEKLAKMIDHTILNAHANEGKIANLCKEAIDFGFFSCCVNPYYAKFVAEKLEGSDVKTCVVVGFPLGQNTSKIKGLEAKDAVADGAQEIDMVINVGALRTKKFDFVKDDIKCVVENSHPALVKVIFETCYLTEDEIKKACDLSVEAGAHFVKTSTGMGGFGAFPKHLKIMRDQVGPDIGVKASGGMKNFKDVWRAINAGATRVGTSAGISILEGFGLYKLAPDAWLEPEIPCHFCPSRHAQLSKMPKALYSYYKNKCFDCEFRDQYNKFYE